MHAANLLSKRRQQREAHDKHVGTPTGSGSTPQMSKHQNSKQHLLVDHQSTSSSSMVGPGPGSSSPLPPAHTKHSVPTPPTTISFTVDEAAAASTRQCQNSSCASHHHNPTKKKYYPTKLVDGSTGGGGGGGGGPVATTPTSYRKDVNEHFFNCAHVGLCIMILGVIIMTIAGFVSHLLGFGEPGIIIVTGGACFCAVGLCLLCFGNAWYIRRSRKKALLSFVEIGRTSLDGNELVSA